MCHFRFNVTQISFKKICLKNVWLDLEKCVTWPWKMCDFAIRTFPLFYKGIGGIFDSVKYIVKIYVK
jgi:hypothetical protein